MKKSKRMTRSYLAKTITNRLDYRIIDILNKGLVMTKIAVLTIMYEDGDQRGSAYIEAIQPFNLGDCLHDRVKSFLLSYVKHDRFNYDVGCYFPDDVDEWLSKEYELLQIGTFERAQLDIVDIF